MFEATHSERSSAPPSSVWRLWSDPQRWSEWNEQLEWARLDGELREGAALTVKYRRGGEMRFAVTAFEPHSLLAIEAKLPGCRLGHEHSVVGVGTGSEVAHRSYLRGPTSSGFALLFGRRRMRESAARYVGRVRELAE